MPTRPMNPAEAKKAGTEMYFGFDPDAEYVLRCRVRAYSGRVQRYYTFTDGEAVAPAMRGDATPAQKWDRAERLSWFRDNPGYAIYKRGTEVNPEPMWRDQVVEIEETEDTGEERVNKWRYEEPDTPGSTDDAERGPRTKYPVMDEADSGEAQAQPAVRRTTTAAR